MPVISGVTVDWTDYIAPTTPRVINIPAAAGDPVVEDLWDTLSEEAAKVGNLIYKKLIDRPRGGGRSFLRTGRETGITLVLNNAQIQLEPVVVKLETGTVTTADAAGEVLNDSSATFLTNLVTRGDIILNATDGSHATVLRVNSEQQLVGTLLLGGSNNQYNFGDAYEVLDNVQRAITDGNVTAIDHLGDPINPVLTAFGVDTTRELSTSPALNVKEGVPVKGVAFEFTFVMRLSSDHSSPLLGATVTAEVRKAGEAVFSAAAGVVNEISNGVYVMTATSADMNSKSVSFRFSEATADDVVINMSTAD